MKKKAKKEEEEENVRIGPGDHVLAQGIDFFRDALNARKMSHCVAEGGIGRVYECIKVRHLSFLERISHGLLVHALYIRWLVAQQLHGICP